MLYGLRTVRKSWPLFIFDVCALCLIITALIYGVLHFNGSELYLSNGEAINYASQHITGRSIDLDGLMADRAFADLFASRGGRGFFGHYPFTPSVTFCDRDRFTDFLISSGI